VDCGIDNGILERTGTWYSYKGERLGQGRENVKKLLKENKEMAAQLDCEIRKKVGLIQDTPPAEKSS
jgi:recombination protein RecA